MPHDDEQAAEPDRRDVVVVHDEVPGLVHDPARLDRLIASARARRVFDPQTHADDPVQTWSPPSSTPDTTGHAPHGGDAGRITDRRNGTPA